MPQRSRFNHNRQKPRRPAAPRTDAPREVLQTIEKKPPAQYGKPFILLEDQQKNTFEYARGAWVAYSMSIAELRQDCQVKELPQKVNGMTRYEIRSTLQTCM